jgi:hypothetical protein
LARQIVQRKPPTEISQEEACQQLLAEHSKLFHQKYGPVRWNNMTMALTELELMDTEARNLEGQFRDRLLLALQGGRYSLYAFDDRREKVTVPLELIKPGNFRFESDEMEVEGAKHIHVRFVPRQAMPESENDPPERKPDQNSADLACYYALSILDDKAQRPPNRHGRLTKLARMVRAVLKKHGKPRQENTIEKYIRGTVREWEEKNPGS